MAPRPEQLFSDRRGGTAVAERFEEYKDALNKSFGRADEGRDAFMKGVGLVRDVRPTAAARADREKRLETIEALSKSLTSDQLAGFQGQLDDLREGVAKDWNASFPESGTMTLPTQLAPIDLEIPAKMLVPRQTPLVNSVPRNNTGKGSAVQFRRIKGWTNSGVGGVPDILPFMSSEFPATSAPQQPLPQFGGLSSTTGTDSSGLGLRRGQKITYVADSQVVNYTELGLSDSVSFKAEFISQGFQSVRGLSATALLWAHKMGEERGLLYGRGVAGNGYTGPVSQPAGFAAANVVSANTGGSIANATYSVIVTAVAGGGESVPSAVGTAGTAITGGNVGTITVTFPALPSGATGWNVYMLNAASGNFFFQQFVPAGFPTVLLTSYTSTGTTLTTTSIDTSAHPFGYDGFLTLLLNPTVSGYVGTYLATGSAATTVNSVGGNTLIGGTAPTAVGDAPWQQAFQVLYGSSTEAGNYGLATVGGTGTWPYNAGTAYGQKLLADPDVVYVDGSIRKSLGDFVRRAAGGSTAFRITMPATDATGGMEIGAVVNGIANQVTGRMVDFEVHPYMPPGASFIWSKTLPVPDSEISNTFEVRNVQDYMMIPWPEIQFTYDASTYQLGTFVPYAPAWSGAVVGLLP
jgi:hypothetical protein